MQITETTTTILISGVVAGAVQILKRAGCDRRWGMAWALVLSVIAVVAYGLSNEPTWSRALVWPYLTAIVTVASSAIGLHSAVKNTTEMVQDAADKSSIDSGRFVGVLLLVAAGIAASSCALTAKHPTPAGQAETRRQIADVVERLTLADQIGTEAAKQLASSSLSPDLKIAIGCDILKAIGQDAPSPTVVSSCGRVPTRAQAPLHVAVATAQAAGSCASRQNTVAAALQLLRPIWERLTAAGSSGLQVLGAALRFALTPLETPAPCGGVQ